MATEGDPYEAEGASREVSYWPRYRHVLRIDHPTGKQTLVVLPSINIKFSLETKTTLEGAPGPPQTKLIPPTVVVKWLTIVRLVLAKGRCTGLIPKFNNRTFVPIGTGPGLMNR